MSIISFNFSTSGDKTWMMKYNQPLQIMPQTTKIPTETVINSYPDCSKGEIRDSVIHTSYITRPFTDLLENGRLSKFIYNVQQYFKLCKQLNYKRLLIHLPQTDSEMKYLDDGMNELVKLFSNEKLVSLKDGEYITLVLEIPSFKSGFKENVLQYFTKVITGYFHKFKLNNVELCYDTAHLYANGLDCKDMITLFESEVKGKKLIEYAKIFHLNGNQTPMGRSDRHVQMFDKTNRMTNTGKLMRYLKDKNKVLITENTTSHSYYKLWVRYAKHYNIAIVEENEHIAA